MSDSVDSGLERIISQVDGESTPAHMQQYEIRFTTDATGRVEMVFSINNVIAGMYGIMRDDQSEAVAQFERALREWSLLLQAELDVMGKPAGHPSSVVMRSYHRLYELQERLFLADDFEVEKKGTA